MKEIQLTQGKVALVDDEDYEWLMQWKWHAVITSNKKGYTARRYVSSGEGSTRRYHHMHRVILGIEYNYNVEGDHKDGDGLNNQRRNLRTCSRIENVRNTPGRHRTSQYKGVYLSGKKWVCSIGIKGRQIYIGRFCSEICAAKAYNEAAIRHHGEFAKLNAI